MYLFPGCVTYLCGKFEPFRHMEQSAIAICRNLEPSRC